MKLRRVLLGAGVAGLGAIAAAASARLDWWEARPVRGERPFTFREDFEGASALEGLFPRDRSRWTGGQRIPEENTVELTGEEAHSGRQALKCRAAATSGGVTSKADLERGGLRLCKGDRVWSEWWVRLKGGTGAENVFFWDLETSRKWKSPGRRLYLQSGDVLASDLGKWPLSPTFRQPWDRRVPLPKDRWVRLRVHLLLSEGKDGAMEAWQDEVKVIDAHGQTLPTAKTVYDRWQIGLTANGSTEHEHTVYVDDVAISNQPLW